MCSASWRSLTCPHVVGHRLTRASRPWPSGARHPRRRRARRLPPLCGSRSRSSSRVLRDVPSRYGYLPLVPCSASRAHGTREALPPTSWRPMPRRGCGWSPVCRRGSRSVLPARCVPAANALTSRSGCRCCECGDCRWVQQVSPVAVGDVEISTVPFRACARLSTVELCRSVGSRCVMAHPAPRPRHPACGQRTPAWAQFRHTVCA